MTQSWNNARFKKSCLASLIAVLLSPSIYALESLSDEHLAETTGEGVALVLDDFKMVFQGPNDKSTGSSYNRQDIRINNPAEYDTGFIRIIPTGENYEILGQRAYSKVYDKTYKENYIAGRTSRYDAAYTAAYDSNKASYRTANFTTVNDKAKADAVFLRSSMVAEYLNSDLMKRYYAQRYDDYYDGTIVTGLVDDGTTSNTLTAWQKNKSAEFALKNTYEMIELLYGKDAAKNMPSNEWSRAVTRSDALGNVVTTYVTNETESRLEAAAIKFAKEKATTAAATILTQIIADATAAAKAAAAGATVGSLRTKADVFIYGLALSKSDDSLSSRYSNTGFNWGGANNPWLIRAGNSDTIQFEKNNKANVGYIALEAPLKVKGTDTSDTFKLGFWSDIFSRQLNSSNVVDPLTGAPTAGLDKDYRLRTQFIANGLNLNGSQVRLFQTLPSTANSTYNRTLGMAAILRLNTNDNPALTGYADEALYVELERVKVLEAKTNKTAAENAELANLDPSVKSLLVEYKANKTALTNRLTVRNTEMNKKGIRISTAVRKGTDANPDMYDGTAVTPAIDRSLAPTFNDVEGMYLYSLNINLVLGNMYQPFILGSEGNNIILEVTRIPNVPAIYSQIYTYYSDTDAETTLKDGATGNSIAMVDKDGLTYDKLASYFKGSTCNVYSCGTEITTTANNVTTTYQGRNATHSSITIGTVERSATGNLLNASKAADATGVVFKNINGQATNLGSVAIDGVLIQHLKIKTTGL